MSDPSSRISALTIVLGGVDFEAHFRDGSSEQVKIRQLPIELIERWALLSGDEAGLVELYCDREDHVGPNRLRVLRVQETRLLGLINEAAPDQFDALESQLAALREKIDAIEKVPRWDSKLIPESHDAIVRIGAHLNDPIFARWAEDRSAAIGQLRKMREKMETVSSAGASSPPSSAASSQE